jgi:hypothetical protein
LGSYSLHWDGGMAGFNKLSDCGFLSIYTFGYGPESGLWPGHVLCSVHMAVGSNSPSCVFNKLDSYLIYDKRGGTFIYVLSEKIKNYRLYFTFLVWNMGKYWIWSKKYVCHAAVPSLATFLSFKMY